MSAELTILGVRSLWIRGRDEFGGQRALLPLDTPSLTVQGAGLWRPFNVVVSNPRKLRISKLFGLGFIFFVFAVTSFGRTDTRVLEGESQCDGGGGGGGARWDGVRWGDPYVGIRAPSALFQPR